MIRVVIVDDEVLALDLLERMIGHAGEMQVVGKFSDPEIALAEIPRLDPEIVFLDVDMPVLNGIELGERLIDANVNREWGIVFVTAFQEYAIHAFKLNAIHYILKPVDPSSIMEVIKRVGLGQVNQSKPTQAAGGVLNLFGHVQLHVGDRDIEFLTSKVEELLALLIMNREKGIRKWVLMDTLWDEISVEKSQQNLHTTIYRLKKTLKSAGVPVEIKCKNSIYTIHLDQLQCDVVEFDEFRKKAWSLNEQNIGEFERMIALYQGDLFEGKDYLWSLNLRELYYQQYVEWVRLVIAYYRGKNETGRLESMRRQVQSFLEHEDYIELL